MGCPPSWIFVDMHVTSHAGSHNVFILTTTDHYEVKIILQTLLEITKSLKAFKTSTNLYLVTKEYFYMANPACDVTKTTVNEIKNHPRWRTSHCFQSKYVKN